MSVKIHYCTSIQSYNTSITLNSNDYSLICLLGGNKGMPFSHNHMLTNLKMRDM